jgi:hypothetical protein
MRLQLFALAARPMKRQQPDPFTPALAQRQGFTTELLEEMIASSKASQELIENIIDSRPSNKHKQLEMLIKTIEQAHYIATSLSDKSWLKLPTEASVLAINNPNFLRRLGPGSGLKKALRSFKESRPRLADEVITQLAEGFYDLRNSLEAFVLEQQNEAKLKKYILGKRIYGLWYPDYRENS